MLRRQLLLGAAAGAVALALGGCDGTGETTVQGIIDWLKDKCNFLVDAQTVIKVILTVVSSINAEAGTAAVVINSVAERVETMICDAVKQKLASDSTLKAAPKGTKQNITVVVNGVEVSGDLTK